METLLQIAQAIGPTAAVGVVAFFFIEKIVKNNSHIVDNIIDRHNKTVSRVVKEHRDDFTQLQKSSQDAMIRISESFREDIRLGREKQSKDNSDLIKAIKEFGQSAECQFDKYKKSIANK